MMIYTIKDPPQSVEDFLFPWLPPIDNGSQNSSFQVSKTSFFKKVTQGVFYETNISSIGMDKSSINFDIDINVYNTPAYYRNKKK